MEELLAAIEASRVAVFLRSARWLYPAVNTGHILGLALLVGAVVPMDLRLVGAFRRDVALADTLRLLRPVAASGAALAITTGFLLFTVKATEYAALPLFRIKMALVLAAIAHALLRGPGLAGASPGRRRMAGIVSLALWLAALTCGRMIGYL